MTYSYELLAVGIMAAVTALLRFLPFAVFKGRETPAVLTYLGKALPFAVMGMLCVYCIKDIGFGSLKEFLPITAAVVVTVVLHTVKRNTLLSIIGGTAVYMIMIRLPL